MTIYELLAYGSIVYGDRVLGIVVTYNGKDRFNMFESRGRIWLYKEIDMWTCYEEDLPINISEYVAEFMSNYR